MLLFTRAHLSFHRLLKAVIQQCPWFYLTFNLTFFSPHGVLTFKFSFGIFEVAQKERSDEITYLFVWGVLCIVWLNFSSLGSLMITVVLCSFCNAPEDEITVIPQKGTSLLICVTVKMFYEGTTLVACEDF